MGRDIRQTRSIASDFTTREDGEGLRIEGYFAVFNSNYDIGPGMSESIAPGAFKNTLADDIRALVNHDTTLVLGRTSAHTLELREDERGLWGRISINPKDTDAMNLYERVKRGDVSQCSIGFNIVREDTEISEDESVHWTIQEVRLYEVTCCTFPAYKETNISAREAQRDEFLKRRLESWRTKMKARLKDGTQSDNAEKED